MHQIHMGHMLDRVSRQLSHCMVGLGPHCKEPFGPFGWNQRLMKWAIFPPTKHQTVPKFPNQERSRSRNTEQNFFELRLKFESVVLSFKEFIDEKKDCGIQNNSHRFFRKTVRDAEIESTGSIEKIFISKFIF